jgi:hypothetical protein
MSGVWDDNVICHSLLVAHVVIVHVLIPRLIVMDTKERGYDRRWVLVREVYIREHPLCEDCLLLGLVVVTQMVHHIVAIVDGGDKYDDDNLRSLCWICHGKYAEHNHIL